MSTSRKENWRHRKRISDEQIAARLREVQARLMRVPRATDFNSAMRLLVRKRFGSWGEGIRKLLNAVPERHYWSDEELLAALRELHSRLGRFPEWNDVRSVKPSLTETIRMRFGGLNAALEKAIGTSPRTVLLAALQRLTPPGCDVATTQEIVAALNDKRMTTQRASVHLCELRRDGFIQQGRYNIATWWRLTPAGREFLSEKNNAREDLSNGDKTSGANTTVNNGVQRLAKQRNRRDCKMSETPMRLERITTNWYCETCGEVASRGHRCALDAWLRKNSYTLLKVIRQRALVRTESKTTPVWVRLPDTLGRGVGAAVTNTTKIRKE